MKKTFLTSLLLVSSQIFAMPNVGDSVTLSGNVGTMPLTVTQEIIGANADRSSFEVKSTTIAMGETSVETEMMSAEDVPSTEEMEMALTLCESSFGGKLEILSVAGENLETCRISEAGTSVWLGNIPFGTVKVSGTDENTGMKIDLTVVSFTKAQ